jgi:hypothetical protein
MRTDGREATSRFSQFCERAKKRKMLRIQYKYINSYVAQSTQMLH